MIPMELITMGVSTLGGFWLKNMANNAERLHEERLAYKESVKAARNDKAGVLVRRFIVFVMVMLFVFIVAAPAFMDIQTVIIEDGWFGKSQMKIDGIMYDETMRMTITSIIGYYFGTSAAGR
jgi:hypothetical protein